MKYYSFDIFDTCLVRLCGEPHNVFEVLSHRVQAMMGENCTEHMRQMFVATRINCNGHSLVEIYSQVAELFPLPCGVEEMVQLELDVERDMLVPVLTTRKLIEKLRTKGNIMFVSDMYLSDEFIREQLIRHGFYQEGDRLYVSDTLGAWKYDGTLFRLIHENEGIPFRRWHHYGDNIHSDVKQPRRLGIKAHYLHYDYLPYEEQWRKIPVLQYQYPAIMAGIARAERLSSDAPEDQKAFVCDVSAPLMVAWVMQVMNEAQRKGICRLYFCARDVHTEYLIARQLQHLYANLEVRYLFVSMKAMEGDQELLRGYLMQEGVLSEDSVALVDSNSSGNTLIRINAFATAMHLCPVQGFYINAWNPRKLLVPTNIDIKSIHYLDYPQYTGFVATSVIKRLSGMRILFELLLSINYHKRTVGYEYHNDRVRPVFETDSEDNWYIKGSDAKQAKCMNDQMVLAFAKSFVSTGLCDYTMEVLKQIVIPSIAEFLDRPRKAYLNYLHRFVIWNRPFVGSIRNKNKGVWSRGNHFYRLPGFLANPLRLVLADADMRRKLNSWLSWKNR